MPPHRFMNAVYTWCIARVDPEKLEDWKMMLDSPLPGHETKAPSAEVLEQEGADFMALMQMQGGGAGGT